MWIFSFKRFIIFRLVLLHFILFQLFFVSSFPIGTFLDIMFGISIWSSLIWDSSFFLFICSLSIFPGICFAFFISVLKGFLDFLSWFIFLEILQGVFGAAHLLPLYLPSIRLMWNPWLGFLNAKTFWAHFSGCWRCYYTYGIERNPTGNVIYRCSLVLLWGWCRSRCW